MVLTGQARLDLREIGHFIAQDNPAAAGRVTAELRRQAEGRDHLPDRYALVDPDRGIRRCTVGNHLILYRVQRERVLVLRIVHGARLLTRILAAL